MYTVILLQLQSVLGIRKDLFWIQLRFFKVPVLDPTYPFYLKGQSNEIFDP